jgi:stearoyl-CoA desaturase (Delta-9 desaturase)
MAMVIFLFVHWQMSVFFQSFFLHRYGAHKQFTMSPRVERVMHFLSWFVMGSSYLSPRAYAILHRMHHAYSDTAKDPHSPVFEPNFFKMMNNTKVIYRDIRHGKVEPEARFDGDYPVWPLLDTTLSTMVTSVAWGVFYSAIYMVYAYFTHTYWVLALAPLHWFLGPIHGAIVNYCGHKIGYRNFDSDDGSKNTLVFDVLTMGELFQNNHHKFSQSPNFGARWFEIDPTYAVIRVLSALKLIKLTSTQLAHVEPRQESQKRSKSVSAAAKSVATRAATASLPPG